MIERYERGRTCPLCVHGIKHTPSACADETRVWPASIRASRERARYLSALELLIKAGESTGRDIGVYEEMRKEELARDDPAGE